MIKKTTLFTISENVSHSQIASSPFLRDDNKIPNFTPPQIEEKEKSNSSLSTTGESDANEVTLYPLEISASGIR